MRNTREARVKKPDSLHVGDFVYCRSKYYRDQLQLPQELGLVIEIKRTNIKVLYAGDKRCWLPLETIARVKPELSNSTLAERLHYLIKRVHADECEIVSVSGVNRVTLRIDHIDQEAVDDVRKFLGDKFISLAVVPEGMAYMHVEIKFS